MDTGTGLTILGGAVGSAKLVEKVLGPTAEYLGESLRDFMKRRGANLAAIFNVAAQRLGTRLDEPGQVPPKVLKEIVDHGSWCEDRLSAEYFGGILASARTPDARDDRAASLVSLVGRLSTCQIRSHYVFYKIVHELFAGTSLRFNRQRHLQAALTFIPMDVFSSAGLLDSYDLRCIYMTHIFGGLCRESLIDSPEWGERDILRLRELTDDRIQQPGIMYHPSMPGVELFMAAHGYITDSVGKFNQLAFDSIEGISIPEGSISVYQGSVLSSDESS